MISIRQHTLHRPGCDIESRKVGTVVQQVKFLKGLKVFQSLFVPIEEPRPAFVSPICLRVTSVWMSTTFTFLLTPWLQLLSSPLVLVVLSTLCAFRAPAATFPLSRLRWNTICVDHPPSPSTHALITRFLVGLAHLTEQHREDQDYHDDNDHLLYIPWSPAVLLCNMLSLPTNNNDLMIMIIILIIMNTIFHICPDHTVSCATHSPSYWPSFIHKSETSSYCGENDRLMCLQFIR